MSESFSESFWGDKASGLEVLFQNLRHSQTAVKEFELFLRECSNNEEQYVKQLNKVTAQMQKFSPDSSLSPVWQCVLKDLNEHNAWAHLHFMHRLQELTKEVQSYHESLRKKKRKLRESELQTQLSVETYRALKAQLTKSKEQYVAISCELDKHNQLFEYNQNHSPNSTPVQQLALSIQKLEKKYLQAQDEYRQVVDKYNLARADYEARFTKSSQIFQTQEETHLEQMRRFVLTYTQLVAQLNSSRQKNFNDCQQKLNADYSNDVLLQLLIGAKSTGRERPQDVEFVAHMLGNCNNSSFSTINSNSELNLTTTTRNTQSPTTTARVFDFHEVKRAFVADTRSMSKNKSHENLSSSVAQELNNTGKSNGLHFGYF